MNQAVLMEHRWGRRIRCDARVRLSAGAGSGAAGRLRNVSLSGAFLETAIELPLFARVGLTVVRDDPLTGHEVEVMASVVRREPDGVGIEWCETPRRSICEVLGCATRCAAAQRP